MAWRLICAGRPIWPPPEFFPRPQPEPFHGDPLMALPTFETLLYTVDDGIATVTLNRPEKMNAFTTQMRDDLVAVFDETDANDDVRVVIITGAGRAFCAGADLSSGGKTFDYASRGESARDKYKVGDVSRRRRDQHAAHLQEPQTRDRRDQRRGGRRRHDDTDADGHPHGQPRRTLRLRVRAPRHHARGGIHLVPVATGGHADGAGMVLHRPGVQRAGGPRPRLGAIAARTRRVTARR